MKSLLQFFIVFVSALLPSPGASVPAGGILVVVAKKTFPRLLLPKPDSANESLKFTLSMASKRKLVTNKIQADKHASTFFEVLAASKSLHRLPRYRMAYNYMKKADQDVNKVLVNGWRKIKQDLPRSTSVEEIRRKITCDDKGCSGSIEAGIEYNGGKKETPVPRLTTKTTQVPAITKPGVEKKSGGPKTMKLSTPKPSLHPATSPTAKPPSGASGASLVEMQYTESRANEVAYMTLITNNTSVMVRRCHSTINNSSEAKTHPDAIGPEVEIKVSMVHKDRSNKTTLAVKVSKKEGGNTLGKKTKAPTTGMPAPGPVRDKCTIQLTGVPEDIELERNSEGSYISLKTSEKHEPLHAPNKSPTEKDSRARHKYVIYIPRAILQENPPSVENMVLITNTNMYSSIKCLCAEVKEFKAKNKLTQEQGIGRQQRHKGNTKQGVKAMKKDSVLPTKMPVNPTKLPTKTKTPIIQHAQKVLAQRLLASLPSKAKTSKSLLIVAKQSLFLASPWLSYFKRMKDLAKNKAQSVINKPGSPAFRFLKNVMDMSQAKVAKASEEKMPKQLIGAAKKANDLVVRFKPRNIAITSLVKKAAHK